MHWPVQHTLIKANRYLTLASPSLGILIQSSEITDLTLLSGSRVEVASRQASKYLRLLQQIAIFVRGSMEQLKLEEVSNSPVDPEVRAYVYSLVSAVCELIISY